METRSNEVSSSSDTTKKKILQDMSFSILYMNIVNTLVLLVGMVIISFLVVMATSPLSINYNTFPNGFSINVSFV